MKHIVISLLINIVLTVLSSCSANTEHSVIVVQDNVLEFSTGDAIIGRQSTIMSVDSLLIILDHAPTDDAIHLFNVLSGNHIVSFGKFGQGPSELTRPGNMAFNPTKRELYVFDYGQNRIMTFNIDSVISSSDYIPRLKLNFTISQSFPDRYVFVNDTLGIARLIQPAKRGFTQSLCRYNIDNGALTPFDDANEKIYANRSLFGVSRDLSLIAEACVTQDLIILYDFNGVIQTRIEGPSFSTELNRDRTYYTNVKFAGNYILCAYSGDTSGMNYYGTFIKIFSSKGKLIKTLDLKKKIVDMSYNPLKISLFLVLDDEIQFGELPLSNILP